MPPNAKNLGIKWSKSSFRPPSLARSKLLRAVDCSVVICGEPPQLLRRVPSSAQILRHVFLRLVSRSGRPLGLVAQGDGRLARLRDDLGMVEGGEFSAATQDATVDDHGVHNSS